jgi:hypothetical protein
MQKSDSVNIQYDQHYTGYCHIDVILCSLDWLNGCACKADVITCKGRPQQMHKHSVRVTSLHL